jgi:hypothetical protein
MQKIISLFQRNYDTDGMVRDELVPGAEWVIAGEGVATRKWDGTCCMIRGGKLYKRYDAKNGKTPPPGFEPAQEPDPKTGHWPGWLLVEDEPECRWHREAEVMLNWPHDCQDGRFVTVEVKDAPDGTYELVGPKIQGNPANFTEHVLLRHGQVVLADVPRDFAGLKAWFEGDEDEVEGIVWHHPDGRMVKIKRKDFFKRSK